LNLRPLTCEEFASFNELNDFTPCRRRFPRIFPPQKFGERSPLCREEETFGRPSSGFDLCVPRTSSVLIGRKNRLRQRTMIVLLCFALTVLVAPFKSKSRLEAENAALRHQLIVLRRKMRGRIRLTNNDRLFFVRLTCWFPSILKVLTIIRPETLVRWHRAGFRRYWRWKSRSFGGRQRIDTELRALIRQMSIDNRLWGAPRIHGQKQSSSRDEYAASASQCFE
jgi:hypothetical protein